MDIEYSAVHINPAPADVVVGRSVEIYLVTPLRILVTLSLYRILDMDFGERPF